MSDIERERGVTEAVLFTTLIFLLGYPANKQYAFLNYVIS